MFQQNATKQDPNLLNELINFSIQCSFSCIYLTNKKPKVYQLIYTLPHQVEQLFTVVVILIASGWHLLIEVVFHFHFKEY